MPRLTHRAANLALSRRLFLSLSLLLHVDDDDDDNDVGGERITAKREMIAFYGYLLMNDEGKR